MPPSPTSSAVAAPRNNMLAQQAWVSRLRWVAGVMVVSGGLLEYAWLHWYGTGLRIAFLGCGILAYNAVFRAFSRWIIRQPRDQFRESVYVLVWTQIIADLICLTFLTLLTGGYDSPLRSLFVCHMVFASLLLDRIRAFGVALVAIGMIEAAMLITGGHPTQSQIAIGLGWDLTLLATVYLANRLTQSLRTQRLRLIQKNRRIRAMSDRLARQQQSMIQQEKMVAMGQMAAGVAHEVANPLASMDGLLQLLERRPEKITPENLARLREQIARINTIVRQLTDFAHPGGDWQLANLNDVVSTALEVLRFDRRLKQTTIEKNLDPAIPPTRLQPAAIEQVLINLALNAADAMDGVTNPRLEVATQLAPGEILLRIADNGAGITPAIRTHIFEPFFTTKPIGKGTGLGLSISYSLVQKHAGRIEVSSIPNQGTTFEIHLPIPPQSPATSDLASSQDRESPKPATFNIGKIEIK
jgi:signal transduction histidine kinase